MSIQYRSNPASYIPKLLVQELQALAHLWCNLDDRRPCTSTAQRDANIQWEVVPGELSTCTG